jgi:protein O-mannosyl-transferase
LLTLAVYRQAGRFGFIQTDDELYVYGNSVVKSGLHWGTLLRAFTQPAVGNWHPFTMISLMLDVQIGGPDPFLFHWVNLALHLAGTLCLILALHRLTQCFGRSLFVGAIFALHPTHVESVAWISERKDVLSGLFFGLTLLAYRRYCRRREFKAYALVASCLVFGLLSKPMLVSVPFLLLLLDYWPLRRIGRQTSQRPDSLGNSPFLEKIPLFVLAAVFSVITLIVQRSAMDTLESTPIGERLTHSLVSYVAYIGKFFWPVNLAGLYPFTFGSIPWWQPAAAAILLIAITIAVIRSARSRPYLVAGWLWFCISLIPVIGWVQVGPQAWADRYTYIPFIGLSIMLTWGLAESIGSLIPRNANFALAVLGTVAALAMSALTYRYLPHWKDDTAYWQRVVEIRPDFAKGYYNLALAAGAQGNIDRAAALYRKALEVDPRCIDANYGLGNILLSQGRLDEAVARFEAELQINPRRAGVQNNLALALSRRGRSEEALAHYRAALEIEPENLDALRNLGLELLRRNDWDGAEEKFAACLRVQPDDIEAHRGIAGALEGKGRFEEARAHLETAVGLRPDSPQVHANFGAFLSRLGAPALAVPSFQRSLQLDPDFADAQYGLAAALNLQGKKEAAIQAYQDLLKSHPDHYWGHNDFGILLAGIGRLDEALEHLAAAIRIHPEEEAARHNQANVLQMKNRRERRFPRMIGSLGRRAA